LQFKFLQLSKLNLSIFPSLNCVQLAFTVLHAQTLTNYQSHVTCSLAGMLLN